MSRVRSLIPSRVPRIFHRNFLLSFLLLFLVSTPGWSQGEKRNQPLPEGLTPIRQYIDSAWDSLTRSMSTCKSLVDPKLAGSSVLYLPADYPVPASVSKLKSECNIQVEHLPVVIHHPGEIDAQKINPPGLLYLENSYVVPGGRFNEMYGWDSYFIVVGLLHDGRIALARGMVDNFFFEIEHYGTVLNANRTYYLTRSQPPFLTSMVMDVFEAEKKAGHADLAWLQKAYAYTSKDYENWVHEPHLAGTTGLSRYFDYGQGPVAEGAQDESGHYRNVMTYFLDHPERADRDVVELKPGQTNPDAAGFVFRLQLCEDTQAGPRCESLKNYSLSHDYYKGDRSMRESGFDISFRFGPFGAQTHHYAPVCLNSLLYKNEKDLEQMATLLGKKQEAEKWRERAEARKALINKYLWDQSRGLFFDYNFETQQRSTYVYASTFYPLWAGLASDEQARAVVKNLPLFEQPGGLVMSDTDSGMQWDYPFAWAPVQLVAIPGLRNYGFQNDADRLSYKVLSMVAENFRRDGTIREKYNAVTRSTESKVASGYQINVVGFGWTNGAFVELLSHLPKGMVDRLAQEQHAVAAAGAN
jgi:alpha,alpha-trehalase